MTVRRPAALLVGLLLFGIPLAGCAPAGPLDEATPSVTEPEGTPAVPVEPVELIVFAAASLKDAVEQAIASYELAQPDSQVIASFDSSSGLATQIEQGAPADVFLSADATSPRRLVDGGLAVGEPVVFARNALAIVVPVDNPAGIESPRDLAGDGIRIVAAGPEVPISRYAAELVTNLAAEPGYPAGFEAAYAANVVSMEDNVRAVLAKIELGEGDAAIVYATDATALGDVSTISVPSGANVTATYAGVVLAASGDVETAQGFMEWLAGPNGAAIFAGLGFLPPPDE